MRRGDRSAHPDSQDDWLAKKRWSSRKTIRSGTKNVGIAARDNFHSRGDAVGLKSSPLKADEAPTSSADVTDWDDGGIEIAERLEAMEGLGRYERPARRTMFQKEVLSAMHPTSSSWVSDPSFLKPKMYHLPRSELDRRITFPMTRNLKRTLQRTKEAMTARRLTVLGSHLPRPVTLRESPTRPAPRILRVSRTRPIPH